MDPKRKGYPICRRVKFRGFGRRYGYEIQSPSLMRRCTMVGRCTVGEEVYRVEEVYCVPI